MSTYEPGAHVHIQYGGAWYRGVVVTLEHPERCGWWPGVDFTRAVAVRLDPGSGFARAGRRGDFDLLVPDPTSDMLRLDGPAPRALGVVS